MKPQNVKVKVEQLLHRVREVAAADQVKYDATHKQWLEDAAKAKQAEINSHREQAERLEATPLLEWAERNYQYRHSKPTTMAEHEQVIRMLEMAAEDSIAVNTSSDLGRYL